MTVPKGTYGAKIMQVFGADWVNTSFLLHVYGNNNGELRRSEKQVIASNIYDKEFKLNVIHDADHHTIKVYINN